MEGSGVPAVYLKMVNPTEYSAENLLNRTGVVVSF